MRTLARWRRCAPRLAAVQQPFPEAWERLVSSGCGEAELSEQSVPRPGAKSEVGREARGEPQGQEESYYQRVLCVRPKKGCCQHPERRHRPRQQQDAPQGGRG